MTNNSNVTYITLNPNYITGFTEADGCFYISIYKDKSNKNSDAYRITPIFYITQDVASAAVLYSIHRYFFGDLPGKFVKRLSDNTLTYTVRGVTSCTKIIHHFNTYRLFGDKQRNFRLFSLIVKLLQDKKHLSSKSGYNAIIEAAFMMNSKGKTRQKDKSVLLKSLVGQRVNDEKWSNIKSYLKEAESIRNKEMAEQQLKENP